jgi:hypothetical protein
MGQVPEILPVATVPFTKFVFVENAEYDGQAVCHYRNVTHREVFRGEQGTVTRDAYYDAVWFEPYASLHADYDSGKTVDFTIVQEMLEPFVVEAPF